MAIQYKKIIKEIIGPEAKEHGFTLVKNGPAGMTKRNLSVYEKSIDELYIQWIRIELDSLTDELLLWAGKTKEVRKVDIKDEFEALNLKL